MKPVYQSVFDNVLGDCFRACAASIFELRLEDIPNFWEQTQDVSEFWKLNNDWFSKEKGYRCISFQLKKEDIHLVDGVLCVALARSPRGDIDHAVVWRDGVVHDPHPSNAGLAERPDTFTLFIPLDPRLQ